MNIFDEPEALLLAPVGAREEAKAILLDSLLVSPPIFQTTDSKEKAEKI